MTVKYKQVTVGPKRQKDTMQNIDTQNFKNM